MEELVHLSGLLPRLRMCKMLPNLAKIMGITNEELFKVSNQNTIDSSTSKQTYRRQMGGRIRGHHFYLNF